MKKLVLTLFCLAALATTAALAGADAAHARGTRAGCTSGPTTYEGARAFRWCGSASAVVRIHGKTFRFSGGACRPSKTALEIGFGTVVLGHTTTKPLHHFGIAVGRVLGVGRAATHDGTYHGASFSLVEAGEQLASFDTDVVLSGGRTRGSFTSKLWGSHGTVTGTFRCS